MRVELDLPEEYAESKGALRLFLGIELIAKKMYGESWQVKTVRCNFCGECCNVGIQGTEGIDPNTGYCKHRVEESPGRYVCGLGSNRPFSCCAYAAGPDDQDKCCIRWECLG
jgi:hypothetical protein